MANVRVGQARRDRVVRAPEEDDVHQAHPQHEWDDAQRHDLILAEQSFGPDISPAKSDQDDGQGEAGTPPTHQQGRVVVETAFCRRWFSGVKSANQIHGRIQAQPPPQRGER